MSARCPIDVSAPREEYRACGKVADWFVEERDTTREYAACESHAYDALRWNSSTSVCDDNGEPAHEHCDDHEDRLLCVHDPRPVAT